MRKRNIIQEPIYPTLDIFSIFLIYFFFESFVPCPVWTIDAILENDVQGAVRRSVVG
jgi:hypothetical protein